MKARILAGALAALLYGTLSGAQEPEPGEEGLDFGVADDFGYETQEEDVDSEQAVPPEEEGIGGAGAEPGLTPEYEVEQVPVRPDPLPRQPDLEFEPVVASLLRDMGVFGAPVATAGEAVTPADVGLVAPGPEEEAIGGAGPAERADMRGVTLLVGGGIEGYTGDLAPLVNPGGMAGVSANFRPSRVFGFEVGYSGAINEVDDRFVGADDEGADIVRNGGYAALTLGLTATPIQPFVLGGVGVNFYNVSNGEAAGFEDDTVGNVPVGLGVRSHLGSFTADARVNYNFLLGQQFAPGDDDTSGSYAGMINLGGTF